MMLSEFLAARLAEDEAAANRCASGRHDFGRTTWVNRFGMVTDAADPDCAIADLTAYGAEEPVYAHIARHDPARVLREVEAKRKILARHSDDGFPSCIYCGETAPCPDVRDVGAVWRDHPDYDPAWA